MRPEPLLRRQSEDLVARVLAAIPKVLRDLLQTLGGQHVMLAGGAIRAVRNAEPIKDFDLFCDSKEAADACLVYLISRGFKIRTIPGKDNTKQDPLLQELKGESFLSTVQKLFHGEPKTPSQAVLVGTIPYGSEVSNTQQGLINDLLGEESGNLERGIFPESGAPSWGFYREAISPEGDPFGLGDRPVQICTAGTEGLLHGLFVQKNFDLTVCQSVFFWDRHRIWALEKALEQGILVSLPPAWECLSLKGCEIDTPAKILRLNLPAIQGSKLKLQNTWKHAERLISRGYTWDASHKETLQKLLNAGTIATNLSEVYSRILANESPLLVLKQEGGLLVVKKDAKGLTTREEKGISILTAGPGILENLQKPCNLHVLYSNVGVSTSKFMSLIDWASTVKQDHPGTEIRFQPPKNGADPSLLIFSDAGRTILAGDVPSDIKVLWATASSKSEHPDSIRIA